MLCTDPCAYHICICHRIHTYALLSRMHRPLTLTFKLLKSAICKVGRETRSNPSPSRRTKIGWRSPKHWQLLPLSGLRCCKHWKVKLCCGSESRRWSKYVKLDAFSFFSPPEPQDSSMLARSNLIDYSLVVGVLVYDLEPCDGPNEPAHLDRREG